VAILSISSQVARGYVGNSATLAALHVLDVEVWTIPTILLSNHKAHKYCFGTESSSEQIQRQFDALENNGWIGEIDAVLTGYMASPDQARVCAEIVTCVKAANSKAFFWCDPVLGDDPGGLYVNDEIAQAVKRDLVPIADILSPNAFELGWLSAQSTVNARAACKAAATLNCRTVMATSIPGQTPVMLSNLLIQDQSFWQIDHEKFDKVPHGTGDLFTALACGHFFRHGGNNALGPAALVPAFENATASLFSLAERKAGSVDDNLSLSDIRDAALSPKPPLKAIAGSP
jgi:pyridoxine kinase